MSYNVDIIILVIFLLINLLVGIYSGKGIKNIKEYAVGSRNFPTATLVATIVATWISATTLTITVAETYSSGLYYIIPGLADTISFVIIALFIAPRMKEFLGSVSVAEAMDKLYGNNARAITSILGVVPSIGVVAAQFILSSILLQNLTGVSGLYASLLSAFIVICYSTFGGIKSVTFTDMIQFATFCIVIPTLGIAVFENISNTNSIFEYVSHSELYSFKEFFNSSNPKFYTALIVFTFYLMPDLDSAIFQRISMARDTKQAKKAFLIAAGFCLLIDSMLRFIGMAIAAKENVQLAPNDLILHIINDYTPYYLKGIAVVGILAMIMSSADSYINSSSVLFSHDFCKSMGLKLSSKSELLLARISAFFIGLAALILSIYYTNILGVMVAAYSFYSPVVSVPLLLAIFGFRTGIKAALSGMAAGFTTVVSFMLFTDMDGYVWGLLANLTTIFTAHYLFRQPGGWVGIKDTRDLEDIRDERKIKWENNKISLKNFNFTEFCNKNAPKDDKYYVYLGLFSAILLFSSIYTMSQDSYTNHYSLITLLQFSVLTFSTILITYPVWKSGPWSKNFIVLIWNFALIYSLIFSSSLIFITSNLEQSMLTIMVISFITLAVLVRWQVSVIMICIGMLSSFLVYTYNYGSESLTENISGNFKAIWSLLVVSGLLIAFFKPKQEYQEMTEAKLDYQFAKMSEQQKELIETFEMKNEFLRNLNHETRTPIVGITTMGQILYENYDNLNEHQRKDALREISSSSSRLSSLVNNLIDLSQLSSINFKLNIQNIDLSTLVKERVEFCKKLYISEEDSDSIQIILDIEKSISCKCDKHYIANAIDNMIINAIQYCKNGKISVGLHRKEAGIEFSVEDEGIGIPGGELYNIFGAFAVGTRTRTNAGGRGVGLALCKKAVESHGGRIWAESDGVKGASFRFVLNV